MHPLQSRNQIQLAGVGGIVKAGGQVAENIKAMIHPPHHHVLVLGQPRAMVAQRAAAALIVTTAVNPDHHGTLAAVVHSLGPDIQVQAIFARAERGRGMQDTEILQLLYTARAVRLRSEVPVLKSIADARPWLRRLWGHKAIGAAGWRAIRNSFEGMHAIDDAAAELAASSGDDGSAGAIGGCTSS